MSFSLGNLMRIGRLSRPFFSSPAPLTSLSRPLSSSSLAPLSSLSQSSSSSSSSFSSALRYPLQPSPFLSSSFSPLTSRRWQRHSANKMLDDEVKEFEQAKNRAGPDEYSQFVYNLSLKNKPRLALGYVEEMRRKNFKLTPLSFLKFLHCLFHAKETYYYKKLLSEFEYWSTEIRAPTIAYNLALNCCVKKRDWAKSQELLELMEERKMAKYDSTFNILLQLCVVCRKPLSVAAGIYEEMKREEIQPTVTTYNILFKICLETKSCAQGIVWFEELLRQASTMKFELNSLLLTNATLLYFGENKVEGGLRCFEEMLTRNYSPYPITWYGVIRGCVRAKKMDLAFSYLDKMEERGVKPDQSVYNSLIRGLIFENKRKQNTKAVELFDKMTEQGFSGDVDTFNSLLSGARNFKSLEKMEEFLEEMLTRGVLRNSMTYDLMLQGCYHYKNFDKAIFYLDEMLLRGFTPFQNIKSTKTNMGLLSRAYINRDYEKQLKFFDLLLRGGFSVPIEGYNMAISACERLNDLDRAIGYYEGSKHFSEPNESTFNSLLKAINNTTKDENKIQEVMTDMENRAFSPSRSSQGVKKMLKESNDDIAEVIEKLNESGELSSSAYNLALKKYAETKDFEKMEKYFKEAKAKGFADSLSHFVMIQALGNGNKPRKALQLFDDLVKSGSPLSESLISPLFVAYSKAKDYKNAVETFELFKTLPNISSDGYIRLYSGMINVSSRTDNMNEALGYFQEMKENGYSPGLVVYNTVLNCCAHAQNTTDIEDIFHEMKKNPNVEPDVVTYSTLIKAMGRGGDLERALFYFEEMKDKGLEYKQPKVYGKLISACISCKNFEKANHYFDEMRGHGMHDPVSYESMINVCAHAHDVEKADKLYKEMLDHNMKPHSFVFTKLVMCCLFSNDFGKAFDFYDQMKKQRVGATKQNFLLFNYLMRCAQKSKNSTKFTEVYHDMCSAGVTPIRRVFILMLQSFGGGDDQKKEELAEFAVGEMKKYKITSDDYLVYVLRSLVGEKKSQELLRNFNITHQTTKNKEELLFPKIEEIE